MSRLILRFSSIAVVAALGFLGWRWLSSVPVRAVEVRGFVHADSSALAALAGVEIGQPIMSVSAAIVADRVRRYPWVEAASTTRHPTGTVVITVRERRPVGLYLADSGAPAYYLDAEGYRMPAVRDVVAQVPIFRGVREAYHPVSPIRAASVRRLLALLPELPREQDALLSEVHETRDGTLVLYTAVTPAGQSVRVLLGRDHFEEKMDRLQAFWMQSVLRNPTTRYEWIDLRFQNQVVSRERA
jgi:cell division protein FtsQ